MARITVEDCLAKESNRFALVQLAAKRTKQLLQGAKTLITDARSNKAVVTALREIADGKVRFMTPEEAVLAKEQEALRQGETPDDGESSEKQSAPPAVSLLEDPFLPLVETSDDSDDSDDTEEAQGTDSDDSEADSDEDESAPPDKENKDNGADS